MELSQHISDVQIAALLNISRATVWRWVKRGILPQPRKIAHNTTRWVASEVEEAIKAASK